MVELLDENAAEGVGKVELADTAISFRNDRCGRPWSDNTVPAA